MIAMALHTQIQTIDRDLFDARNICFPFQLKGWLPVHTLL